MKLSTVELFVIFAIVAFLFAGPAVNGRLGLRSLNFRRPSDVAIAIGIVATFLVTFLWLDQNR